LPSARLRMSYARSARRDAGGDAQSCSSGLGRTNSARVRRRLKMVTVHPSGRSQAPTRPLGTLPSRFNRTLAKQSISLVGGHLAFFSSYMDHRAIFPRYGCAGALWAVGALSCARTRRVSLGWNKHNFYRTPHAYPRQFSVAGVARARRRRLCGILYRQRTKPPVNHIWCALPCHWLLHDRICCSRRQAWLRARRCLIGRWHGLTSVHIAMR